MTDSAMAIIHQLKNTVVEKVTTGNAMRLKYHLSTIPKSGGLPQKRGKSDGQHILPKFCIVGMVSIYFHRPNS